MKDCLKTLRLNPVADPGVFPMALLNPLLLWDLVKPIMSFLRSVQWNWNPFPPFWSHLHQLFAAWRPFWNLPSKILNPPLLFRQKNKRYGVESLGGASSDPRTKCLGITKFKGYKIRDSKIFSHTCIDKNNTIVNHYLFFFCATEINFLLCSYKPHILSSHVQVDRAYLW